MDRLLSIDPQSPKPLYLQIVEDIKEKILTNQLKPGDRVGSHSTLTHEYGVSLITVKRALNELLKDGFLYSRVGKGTYVSQNVYAGSYPGAGTLGFVLTDFKNPFFTMILHVIEKYASQNGYNLLFTYSSDCTVKEENQIQQFRNMGVKGLIIASTEHINEATPAVRQLHREAFPYIMISYIDDPDIYYVGTDHEKGAYMAACHFIDLGYRRLGYVNAEKGNHLGMLRQSGFRRALEEKGLPWIEKYNFSFPYKRKDYESGYAVGKSFSEMSDRPEALFFFNDFSALGFQHAVLERNLAIPEDIAIIGFDDIRKDMRAQVPLTTVHQPIEEIGRLTIETLMKCIEGKPVDVRTILEPNLVVRVSSGAVKHKGVKNL